MNFRTVPGKINNWFHKHWSVIRHRPQDGEFADRAIEPILKEMRDNNLRVSKAIKEIARENDVAQRIVADVNVINDNRS
jgi:hypothetical protein